ncbi:MAG: hypothetical protein JWO95_3170, partial [Verrucomicrobiales bacterium]|nr:hypothetical protein [Verrucomicrobiales bacterium]
IEGLGPKRLVAVVIGGPILSRINVDDGGIGRQIVGDDSAGERRSCDLGAEKQNRQLYRFHFSGKNDKRLFGLWFIGYLAPDGFTARKKHNSRLEK